MAKTRPNDPCPCGSGKKYKKCHRNYDTGTGPFSLKLSGGREVLVEGVQLKTSVIHEIDHRDAEFFLQVAARAVQLAQAPAAAEHEAFQAIVDLSIASEALANRLLEPLVNKDEWEDLERKALPKKWLKLGSALKLSPGWSFEAEPLKGIDELHEARSDIVHFKHGENLTVEREEVPSRWAGGNAAADLTGLGALPRTREKNDQVRLWLTRDNALRYYVALTDALRRVLEVHPSDRFQVVPVMKKLLDRLPRAQAMTDLWGDGAAWAAQKTMVKALNNAGKCVETAVVKDLNAPSPEQRLMYRIADSFVGKVRAIHLLSLEGLSENIEQLAKEIVELGVVVSFIGEEHGKAATLQVRAVDSVEAWLEHCHVTGVLPPNESDVEDLAKARAALGPHVPPRSLDANSASILELAAGLPGAFGAWSREYLDAAPARDVLRQLSPVRLLRVPQMNVALVAAVRGTLALVQQAGRVLPLQGTAEVHESLEQALRLGAKWHLEG